MEKTFWNHDLNRPQESNFPQLSGKYMLKILVIRKFKQKPKLPHSPLIKNLSLYHLGVA